MLNSEPNLDDYYQTEKQIVNIEDFSAEGFILDVCGGGEGVIGRLKGSQVINIDKSKNELQELSDDSLKIVMDASALQFLDNTFNTATIFCGFMYIKPDIRQKVFEEIHRVLKPNGKLLLWDVTMPTIPKEQLKKYFLLLLEIQLPTNTINTGYGVNFIPQDKAYYKKLAKKAGFILLAEKDFDQMFYLEFKKKG